MPKAIAPWALDSGGFSELAMYGGWKTSESEYVDDIQRFQSIGMMQWCAPQDWMCEPVMLEKTGLSILEHQARTITSVLSLRSKGMPVIPVLQGWELADYHRHLAQYRSVGIVLESEPLVGIGSVCRRQSTEEIGEIVSSLQGIRLHGFGVKTKGLGKYGQYLHSADSMSWSYAARRAEPMAGCTTHINCANCLPYAKEWRRKLLSTIS